MAIQTIIGRTDTRLFVEIQGKRQMNWLKVYQSGLKH